LKFSSGLALKRAASGEWKKEALAAGAKRRRPQGLKPSYVGWLFGTAPSTSLGTSSAVP
jgi:hypothetical protein